MAALKGRGFQPRRQPSTQGLLPPLPPHVLHVNVKPPTTRCKPSTTRHDPDRRNGDCLRKSPSPPTVPAAAQTPHWASKSSASAAGSRQDTEFHLHTSCIA